MIPPSTLSAGHDRVVGGRSAVITALARAAGARARRAGWSQADARGGRSRKEAVECRHPIGGEGRKGTPAGGSVERAGVHGRGAEARGRCVLTNLRHAGERLVDEAEAVADHRLDGMACGHQTPGRGVRGRLVHDCCEATCVTPARDKAPVIEAMTGGGRWHELSSGEEMLPTPKHDATFIGGLRNVGSSLC